MRPNASLRRLLTLCLVAGAAAPRLIAAQAPDRPASAQTADRKTGAVGPAAVAPISPSTDAYVIGPDDELSIVFWRDKDLSADVVVRPDGKISLPLLNDIQAAGFTPDQLRENLVAAAGKYVEQPTATVVVKAIHSRNTYITGKVAKPGAYALTVDMNVMQLIALSGGLLEYADDKNIVVIRTVAGKQHYFPFNYREVIERKHPEQNIVLRPGDTVVVP
jgi:polysaccharide export outer membrane protein